jgi:hypothetical protein
MKAKDKLAIHELLSRAAYAFDERKIDMLKACYSENANMLVNIADGTTYGPFEGREAIMALLEGTLDAQTDTRRHVISNFIFEKEGKKDATVLSQIVLFATENGEIKVLTSGIYRDEVEKNNGTWQITDRLLDLELGF